MIKSME